MGLSLLVNCYLEIKFHKKGEYSKDGKGALVECLEEVDEEGKAKRYWINLDLCKADREAQFFVREEMRKRVKERGSH